MKIILLFGWVRQQIVNCEEEGSKLSERHAGATAPCGKPKKNEYGNYPATQIKQQAAPVAAYVATNQYLCNGKEAQIHKVFCR